MNISTEKSNFIRSKRFAMMHYFSDYPTDHDDFGYDYLLNIEEDEMPDFYSVYYLYGDLTLGMLIDEMEGLSSQYLDFIEASYRIAI